MKALNQSPNSEMKQIWNDIIRKEYRRSFDINNNYFNNVLKSRVLEMKLSSAPEIDNYEKTKEMFAQGSEILSIVCNMSSRLRKRVSECMCLNKNDYQELIKINNYCETNFRINVIKNDNTGNENHVLIKTRSMSDNEMKMEEKMDVIDINYNIDHDELEEINNDRDNEYYKLTDNFSLNKYIRKTIWGSKDKTLNWMDIETLVICKN